MISDSKSMETPYFDARKRSVYRRPVLNNLILHIHPPTIPEKTLALTHTWGLGGMSVVLVMLLAVTGILLMFVYEPFPGQAYDSIVTLQKEVWFGHLVRNIHHWSGNILVIVSFLHLLRVYFTSAFHGPRRLNWVIGLGLLFLVLVSNFTGYLLPWDQQAYWAITICTNMLDYLPGLGMQLQKVIFGGEEIGPATLSIFFTIHIVIMPVCLFLLMPYHFWLVRKAGGVVVPRLLGEDSDTRNAHVPIIPNLVVREAAVGLALIAFVMVYALIFDAPLAGRANPGLSPNPTKAPWFLIGIQEMLMHIHPMFAAWVIPVLMVVLLIAFPYFKYDAEETGAWFCSRKGHRMGMVAALTALVVTPVLVIGSSLFIDFMVWLPKIPGFIRNGLIPLIIILAAILGFYISMKKRYKASNNEAIQTVFILLLVSFVILTIICYWFRGPGMELIFFSHQ
jgi:quinol-cytochrome oxidoreductase complex cytochrome b subunit